MVSLDALRQGTSAVAVVGLGYVGLPLAVALARTAELDQGVGVFMADSLPEKILVPEDEV